MYVAGNKSKIAHNENCPYCKRIKEENRRNYYHTDETIKEGCILCQYYSFASTKYRKQKEQIELTGKKYKLHYEVVDGMMVVNDGMSKWKVFYSSKRHRLMLYHKNYLLFSKRNDYSPILGYHFQHKELKNLIEVFEYISEHFQAYLNNFKFPKSTQNKVNSIYYNKCKHKRRHRKKYVKKEKRLARLQAIRNVLLLIEEIQKEQVKNKVGNGYELYERIS